MIITFSLCAFTLLAFALYILKTHDTSFIAGSNKKNDRALAILVGSGLLIISLAMLIDILLMNYLLIGMSIGIVAFIVIFLLGIITLVITANNISKK